MNDNKPELTVEEDLIVYLSQKVSGIGNKKASAIAAYFDGDIHSFLNTSFEDLRAIPIRKGQLLTEAQTNDLLNVIDAIDKNLTSAKDIWISVLAEDFSANVVNLISKTKLLTPDSSPFDETALTINPLLIKALRMEKPEDVIRFFLSERLTRAIATSWGMRIEEMVGISGAVPLNKNEIKSFEGFDLKKVVGKLTYYIQLKSSTNTMNVDAVRQLNQRIHELESRSKNYRGLLGTTFGIRPSANLTTYLDTPDEHIKVGKEFWDWVAEEEGFYKKVIDLIGQAGANKLSKSFSELYDDKYTELLATWYKVYGEGKESVERFTSLYA